jgi:uncharacterized pyridoxal phosphate-containing UPF0001 family protein
MPRSNKHLEVQHLTLMSEDMKSAIKSTSRLLRISEAEFTRRAIAKQVGMESPAS